eukprot:131198_1
MSLAIVLSCYLSWIMSSNSSKPDYHAIEAKDWPDHNRKYPNDTVLAVADGTLIQTDTHWTRKGEYDEMFKLLKLVEGDDETDLFMSMCTQCNGGLKMTKSGPNSWVTSTMNRHPCYADANPKEEATEEQQIEPSLIRKCQVISGRGHAQCIIKDSRPFRFSEGDGFKEVAKAYIEIGIKCKVMPSDEQLDQIIMKRNGNKSVVKELYVAEEKTLKQHLMQKNAELFPAIHFTCDLWDERMNASHYVGICAHEVDEINRKLIVYCVEMREWEDLVADELIDVSALNAADEGQGYDSDSSDQLPEHSNPHHQDIANETEDSDANDTDDARVDPNWNPNEISTDDETLHNQIEEDDVKDIQSDDDLAVKVRTSVTGNALQANLEKVAEYRGMPALFQSKNTHLTMDRASNNVKCGDQMEVSFTSGALHGFGRKVWTAYDKMTSKKWRKPGQRRKRRNPHYRSKFNRVTKQTKAFSRHVKSRSLNTQFKPRHKTVKKVRWNILCNHFQPYTVKKNIKMVKKVRKYWIKKKKLTPKEKKHEYRSLVRNFKWIKRLHRILDKVRAAYSLLEGDKYPTVHKVLFVVNRLLKGQRKVEDGQRVWSGGIYKHKSNDPEEIRLFKDLLKDGLVDKVIKNLLLCHWEAVVLVPSLKEQCKAYLTDINDDEVCNRRTEAIESLKTKCKQLARWKLGLPGNNNGRDAHDDYISSSMEDDSEDEYEEQDAGLGMDDVGIEALAMDNNTNNRNGEDEYDVREPSRKRRKKSDDFFAFLPDPQVRSTEEAIRDAEGEVDRYLDRVVSSNADAASYFKNPLEFWCDSSVKSQFPHLQKIALHILSIPCSSAACERLFSSAAFILNKYRSGMSKDTVRWLMMLKQRRSRT